MVSKVGQARPKTGGRVKGTPNKTTAAIKDMIIAALDNVGGIKYLEAQAHGNPTSFLSLVGKIVPLQTDSNINLNATHRIERNIVDPANPDR